MTTREKLSLLFDVLGIAVLWVAIFLLATVATAGDCFEPGCGAWTAGYLRTAPAVLAFAFIGHVSVQVWLKLRKARRR